jgi:phosphoglycolate phosphatase
MRYKAAIFDLDGTLVDSLADLADAINYALKQLNQPQRPTEVLRAMIGDGIRTTISRALEPEEQGLVDIAVDKMREKYAQICLDNTKAYKGLTEVVAKLYEKGVKLAVLTNKDQKMARKIVNHFFADYFAVVAGTTSLKPAKPDPQKTLQVLDKLGVMPGQVIFFGDSSVDIQTAKACKIFAVGVSWGLKSKEDLAKAGADIIVAEPSQLLSFFV